MTLGLHALRRAAQWIGVDVRRYPQSDPLWRVAKLLQVHGVDVVLDVGANDGGYGLGIRRHGYQGRIISFEPTSSAFARLKHICEDDRKWTALNVALGGESRSAIINVAGNGAASSSFLAMMSAHLDASPSSEYIGREEVVVRRLDDVVGELHLNASDKVFLKLDVQGFEGEVLRGGALVLASEQLVGVQLELSFVPLYQGGMRWREGLDWADRYGHDLKLLLPGFSDMATGQMLQADALFFRRESITS